MKILMDFVENNHLFGNYPEHDEPLLNQEVDLSKYDSVGKLCTELANELADDAMYCDAEWNLMHYYYDNKGFSKEDWEYVLAHGYDYDQFEEEVDDEADI